MLVNKVSFYGATPAYRPVSQPAFKAQEQKRGWKLEDYGVDEPIRKQEYYFNSLKNYKREFAEEAAQKNGYTNLHNKIKDEKYFNPEYAEMFYNANNKRKQENKEPLSDEFGVATIVNKNFFQDHYGNQEAYPVMLREMRPDQEKFFAEICRSGDIWKHNNLQPLLDTPKNREELGLKLFKTNKQVQRYNYYGIINNVRDGMDETAVNLYKARVEGKDVGRYYDKLTDSAILVNTKDGQEKLASDLVKLAYDENNKLRFFDAARIMEKTKQGSEDLVYTLLEKEEKGYISAIMDYNNRWLPKEDITKYANLEGMDNNKHLYEVLHSFWDRNIVKLLASYLPHPKINNDNFKSLLWMDRSDAKDEDSLSFAFKLIDDYDVDIEEISKEELYKNPSFYPGILNYYKEAKEQQVDKLQQVDKYIINGSNIRKNFDAYKRELLVALDLTGVDTFKYIVEQCEDLSSHLSAIHNILLTLHNGSKNMQDYTQTYNNLKTELQDKSAEEKYEAIVRANSSGSWQKIYSA